MASAWSEFQLVPDDILAEIFLRLPSLDVVRSCVLVCKDWNRVANTQTLWKDKSVRDFQFPEDQIRLLAGEDFKVLYLRNPYCRNLLRNPDAHLGKFVSNTVYIRLVKVCILQYSGRELSTLPKMTVLSEIVNTINVL